MTVNRQLRGVLLIAFAAVLLGLMSARSIWPSPAATATAAHHGGASHDAARQSTITSVRVGQAFILGDAFVAPPLTTQEVALLHALIVRGVDIERVDVAPWAAQFGHASAHIVTTDQGEFLVFASAEPGHSPWVCRSEVEASMIRGRGAPGYELAVGGDRAVVRVGPEIQFSTVGDVLVGTAADRPATLLIGITRPAECPYGQ